MSLSGKQVGYAMRAVILPAWRRACEAAAESGEEWDASEEGFTRWRHEEVMLAVGRDGLSRCENEDFASVMAHFADLAGRPDVALEWHLRAGSDRRRRIEFTLTAAMERFSLGPGYVQAICRDQFHCLVEDASEEQLIHLTRTLTARGRSKRRREESVPAGFSTA